MIFFAHITAGCFWVSFMVLPGDVEPGWVDPGGVVPVPPGVVPVEE